LKKSDSNEVRAKKHLGQHFLRDESISLAIANAIKLPGAPLNILEVGPGMGMLTKYLVEQPGSNVKVIELDRESIAYLKSNFPKLENNIISGDFLALDLPSLFEGDFIVIGNFPYNISTEILFKVLDNKDKIPVCVGMFQKEVAERVAAKPGSKTYGITSVLLQAYYDIEYLFTVDEHVFSPPPKVKSAVIRLTRNAVSKLACNEILFKKVVKAGFNQRRKTLRNAVSGLVPAGMETGHEFFRLRAEQLSVNDFIELTNMLDKS
jgi:16S rRNA (adenine1518-N6/adenine1519-N6)-dimethyltransferase